MLQLKLATILANRGIQKPLAHLVKSGFTYHTAHRLLHNTVDSISFKHLEQLCLALHCSVEELFVWHKPNNQSIPDDHPLGKLVLQNNQLSLAESLRTLPLNKLEELNRFAHTLKQNQ